jgi:hypothetical protein
MAKWIVYAALAGFVVGIFWVVMSFVFFTAEPSGPWWAVYMLALVITCPAWYLPIFPLTPIGNAVIYALIAFFVFKLRQAARGSDRSAAS